MASEPRSVSLEEITTRAQLALPQGARLHESASVESLMGHQIWAEIAMAPDTAPRFEEQYRSATGAEFREGSLQDMYGAGGTPAWWPPLSRRARVAVHRSGEGQWTSIAVAEPRRGETLIYVAWVQLKN